MTYSVIISDHAVRRCLLSFSMYNNLIDGPSRSNHAVVINSVLNVCLSSNTTVILQSLNYTLLSNVEFQFVFASLTRFIIDIVCDRSRTRHFNPSWIKFLSEVLFNLVALGVACSDTVITPVERIM
jgi:hypothetical protein